MKIKPKNSLKVLFPIFTVSLIGSVILPVKAADLLPIPQGEFPRDGIGPVIRLPGGDRVRDRSMDMRSFTPGFMAWTKVERKPIKHIGVGGNNNLMMAMNGWPDADGADNVAGNADDRWMLMPGAALPGTFTPEAYRARSGFSANRPNLTPEQNRLGHHISGGADLVLAYRDGMPGAMRPNGLRWIQTIITNKPAPLAQVQPNVPYIDPPPGTPRAGDNLPFFDPEGNLLGSVSNIQPDIEFLFRDFPARQAWGEIDPATRRPTTMHADWTAQLWAVTWDGVEPAAGIKGGITVHDGIEWGFSVWPKEHERLQRDSKSHGSGDKGSDLPSVSPSMTYDGQDKLSFNDLSITSLQLTGGLPSLGDPFLGATVLIGDTSLADFPSIDADHEGDGGTTITDNMTLEDFWYFEDTTLEIRVGSTTVLTADLVDNFLYIGGGDHPEFDSEFQSQLLNISINNTIGSNYLNDLQSYIDQGGLSHWSFFSNILSASNNLQQDLSSPVSSDGIFWIDGTARVRVPEPSSVLGLLAFGALGAGSALKRKSFKKYKQGKTKA